MSIWGEMPGLILSIFGAIGSDEVPGGLDAYKILPIYPSMCIAGFRLHLIKIEINFSEP